MEGKALAGEGAPGWEECPGKSTVSLKKHDFGKRQFLITMPWKDTT